MEPMAAALTNAMVRVEGSGTGGVMGGPLGCNAVVGGGVGTIWGSWGGAIATAALTATSAASA